MKLNLQLARVRAAFRDVAHIFDGHIHREKNGSSNVNQQEIDGQQKRHLYGPSPFLGDCPWPWPAPSGQESKSIEKGQPASEVGIAVAGKLAGGKITSQIDPATGLSWYDGYSEQKQGTNEPPERSVDDYQPMMVWMPPTIK